MSSLSDIRDGLVTRLKTISGLGADVKVTGNLADLVPFAEVGWPTRIDYDDTQNATRTSHWTIAMTVFVGLADDQVANDTLEDYLASTGSKSIVAAVEGDQTLGGKCDDAVVSAMTGSGYTDVGNVRYLSANFEVDVFA